MRDTSIIVDAAIVRTLKRRKVLPKTELSNEVVSLLNKIKPSME